MWNFSGKIFINFITIFCRDVARYVSTVNRFIKNTPDFSGVLNLLSKNYSKAASAADKILNILTPVSGSTACAAGRPFLSMTLVTLETSTSTDLRDFTE